MLSRIGYYRACTSDCLKLYTDNNLEKANTNHIKEKGTMPNWVSNVATVHHLDHKVIRKLRKACTREEDPIFFEFIRPYEGEWNLEWCVENWGTKWDAKDIKIPSYGHNCLEIHFETAWGPPYELYKFMKEQGYIIFAHNWESCNARFGYWADGEETFHISEKAEACLQADHHTYDRHGKSSWDTDVEECSSDEMSSGDEYYH